MLSFLFDCGNTCIKFALQEKQTLSHHSFVEYVALEAFIDRLFNAHPMPAEIRIASVTTNERLVTLCALLKQYTDLTPLIANAQARAFEVVNHYDNPRQLGIDRWLALVAAWDLYHQPCIVVDLGTALTIDALDGSGNFTGGVIIPGIKSMRDALINDTTLKDIDALDYTDRLGRNTHVGISSGIYYAILGSILAIYRTQPMGALIVFSGGRAKWLAERIALKDPSIPSKAHEDLVLEGLMRYQP